MILNYTSVFIKSNPIHTPPDKIVCHIKSHHCVKAQIVAPITHQQIASAHR